MSTDAWGIDGTYEDAAGALKHISEEDLQILRSAIGQPPKMSGSWFEDCVKVVRLGQSIPLPSSAELTLEDGTFRKIQDCLPHDLPIGYHSLQLRKKSSSPVQVIVSPGRCHFPPGLRIWGWNAQLYATRSRDSWGMGDLADLRRLARWAQSLGAGLMLINPLDAVPPVTPQEASPYSPSSRRYLNPLYLRIEELPNASERHPEIQRLANVGRALSETRLIDRDEVFRLKQEAFQLLWARFKGDPDFDQFLVTEGEALHTFGVFSVLAERHGADWREWPTQYRRPDSEAVRILARTESNRVRSHQWLQWLLNRQLAGAAQSCPLMQDLPIGFSRGGADAWVWQDLIAAEMSIGAPPDLYNTDGQDWGLPPFIPHKLRAVRYEPFIQTIRAALRHAGGLRIDHVMGLFRLWWVPRGGAAKNGGYVRYPADDLLAIIAIESQRAEALVVGEDLGTVEVGVRETLADRNVLSYRLLWFEEEPPLAYPVKALAAITTHDLPTLAGVWTGADLDTQRQIGLEPDTAANEKFREKLIKTSGLGADAYVRLAITKTFEQLAVAPSAIVMATMEAACVATERPNMPTGGDRYPNWSIALPLSLEQLETSEHARTLAGILSRSNTFVLPEESSHAG